MACGCSKKKNSCYSCVFGIRGVPGYVSCTSYQGQTETPVMERGPVGSRTPDGTIMMLETNRCVRFQASNT